MLSLHHLGEALGYLGATLGVIMVVPQIVRTLRDRAMPGVSALSWALTALACATWMLYGFRADEIPQIPGNVLMISGAVLIVLAVPSAASVALRATGLAAAALTIAALAVVLPATGLALVGFSIAVVSTLPQLVKSLGRRGDASAVSKSAWLLRAVSQVAWLVYGIVLDDVMVIVSASFLLTSALALLAVELRGSAVVVPAPAVAEPACVVPAG